LLWYLRAHKTPPQRSLFENLAKIAKKAQDVNKKYHPKLFNCQNGIPVSFLNCPGEMIEAERLQGRQFSCLVHETNTLTCSHDFPDAGTIALKVLMQRTLQRVL
jgi:hypothetical protein